MITEAFLCQALGVSPTVAARWVEPLREAIVYAELSSRDRLSAFLGQIGHETGRLRWLVELWGPTPVQTRYEGRRDLGNTQPGDGHRYRGRGLIQTTGRANYARLRDRLRLKLKGVPDFEAEPDLVATSKWAALAAADYWVMRDINTAADQHNLMLVTRRVNGGTNGMDDRMRITATARIACIKHGVF